MTRLQSGATALLWLLACGGGLGCQLKRPDVIPVRMIEPLLIEPVSQPTPPSSSTSDHRAADVLAVRLLDTQARDHIGRRLLHQEGERRTRRGCLVALVVRARALPRVGAAHRVRVHAERSAGRLRQCCRDGGDPDRVASGVDGRGPAGWCGRTDRDRQRSERSRSCGPCQRARLGGVARRPRGRCRAPSSEAGVGESYASDSERRWR